MTLSTPTDSSRAPSDAPRPPAVATRARREGVHPALEAYLAELPELSAAYEPSVFWKLQLEKLKERAASENRSLFRPEDLEEIVQMGSYAFQDLDPGVPMKADGDYREGLKKVKEIRGVLRGLGADSLGITKGQWEHSSSLLFLAARKLLPEYESFIGPLGIRSSMSTVRHFIYKRELGALLDDHVSPEPVNILEVGGGAGCLALYLTVEGRVRTYTIIDLPEMLVHSAYTIQKYLPEADIVFNEPPGSGSAGEAPRFHFIAAQFAESAPSDFYDLGLNFNSFMEMDGPTRDDYIRLIYRAARPGALFFNVNRRQRALPQSDGSAFDNNPLLYPYRPDDRILRWEEDVVQQATRGRLGGVPSLAITRAALVSGQ